MKIRKKNSKEKNFCWSFALPHPLSPLHNKFLFLYERRQYQKHKIVLTHNQKSFVFLSITSLLGFKKKKIKAVFVVIIAGFFF